MSDKLIKRSAYTLIEVIIVLAILVLTIIVAIPAFSVYGKNQIFAQKIDEVTELMNYAHLLSKNPEKNVLLYELVSIKGDPVSVPPTDNKFILKRCFEVTSGRCTSDSNKYEIVKEVLLLKTQMVQYDDANPPYLTCLANPDSDCTHPLPFSFIDQRVDPSNKNVAIFNATSNPFIVGIQRVQ